MTDWLAGELCPVELDERRLRDDLLARFREERIEPPGASRIDRILGSGRALFERQFTTGMVERLPAAAIEALERLVPPVATGEVAAAGLLVELKGDPGKTGLSTNLAEIEKLERVRALGLPADLFADCSEKLLDAWRARAAAAYPSDLRAMPTTIRLTLLAALCWSRTAEITDALVDLLIDVVDKIRVRAENRVEKALVADLKRVSGKQGYCSHSPAPRSIIPTRPSAPRSTRSSRRRRCASWSRRPRPASSYFVTRSARRSAGPTPTTTGGCCPASSTRSSSAAPTASTGR